MNFEEFDEDFDDEFEPQCRHWIDQFMCAERCGECGALCIEHNDDDCEWEEDHRWRRITDE
jgi:hypothetical protein